MIENNSENNYMKKAKLTLIALLLAAVTISAQTTINKWERFETSFKHHTKQNPFTDVELSATFSLEGSNDKMEIDGFYDGNDTYRLRFMPTKEGKWTYTTHSNAESMDGKTGHIQCIAAKPSNHGMMKVGEDQDFVYSDGKQYYPVGTTAYAWIHASKETQELTYKSLEETGFNKMRFVVFPNNSVNESPELYPFVLISNNENEQKVVEGDEVNSKASQEKVDYVWDYTRFDPRFFQHLEQCVDRLKDIDVEADLILFSPYDGGRWGFDRMTMDTNMRYLRYIVARLGSYSNIWWSIANEWDLCRKKTLQEWLEMSEYVAKIDPYHHLLSIHGSTAKYINYQLPYYTHASIQDQGPLYNFEGAATVRNIIPKPIVFDEVCYEGDHSSRWARLTGEEMIERMWMGIIGGTYVTHGECYTEDPDYYTGNAYLATGGTFRGTSPKRIKFMRSILVELPAVPRLADRSWDPMTAGCGDGSYLIYFGKETPKSWSFSLPCKNDRFYRLKGGERFKVEIIDTWNMTRSNYSTTFEVKPADVKRVADKDGKKVKLPGKPYMMLKITQTN